MKFHSPSSSYTTIFTLLASSASIPFPFVVAKTNLTITTDELHAKISPTAALPGFNAEGNSVFVNFAKAFNEGQFFFFDTGPLVYEKPESEPVQYTALNWCSDLTFSGVNSSSLIGYAGRCVGMFLARYAELVAAGAQILSYDYSEEEFTYTESISAVFVEQQNVFEGQYHENTDDWVARYWDDGRKTIPAIAWEGHDEGDMNLKAATSSNSWFGELTWISVEEVADFLNTSVDEFTPEKFKQVYLNAWIKGHEEEAAKNNPNPLPELEIIEQVKNETNSADDTTPAQPDGIAEHGGSDGANSTVEDGSGSGRKLVSVAARFVLAALRVFGI